MVVVVVVVVLVVVVVMCVYSFSRAASQRHIPLQSPLGYSEARDTERRARPSPPRNTRQGRFKFHLCSQIPLPTPVQVITGQPTDP